MYHRQSSWEGKILFNEFQKDLPTLMNMNHREDVLVSYDQKNYPTFIVNTEGLGSIWERAEKQAAQLLGDNWKNHLEDPNFKTPSSLFQKISNAIKAPLKESLTLALYLSRGLLNETSKALGVKGGMFHSKDTIMTIEDVQTGMIHHFTMNAEQQQLIYQISSPTNYEPTLRMTTEGIIEGEGKAKTLDRSEIKDLFSRMARADFPHLTPNSHTR